uniref:Calcium-dependent protein kinase 3-like n=1 Tax=Dermatophagoides pteronyssinus TaxID=6956 RepID=A0A6P6Y9Z9_DERPT|nr:calcium-dependent protein kinase 3-like [Dermatophagoides pteronyssinus]
MYGGSETCNSLTSHHVEHDLLNSSTFHNDYPRCINTIRVFKNKNQDIYYKYDLKESIIGTGASGVVRLAVNRYTGEYFAVKTLTTDIHNNKKTSMARNEVLTYLKLDHPSIARLIDVFEDDGNIILIMELSSGKELYDHLISKQHLQESDVKQLAVQMLSTIAYCHSQKICHRDLKLENWVFSDLGKKILKLIDFGFGRVFSTIIPMTAMHGTVYYVSPEVIDGCYQHKCDVWAIGVIIYMLLSGMPPFNGNKDSQILDEIKNNSFNFKNKVWNDVSDKAKSFISSLLCKNIALRPDAEYALHHPWLRNKASSAALPKSQCKKRFLQLTVTFSDLINNVS